jgi:alpha-mannosidase II
MNTNRNTKFIISNQFKIPVNFGKGFLRVILINFILFTKNRYTDMQDAHDQYLNYEKLIEHINGNEWFNSHMRFGTLGDYFTELAKLNANNRNVKVLEGDFFTYADRQDHYWSGYYTSRPFNKRLERLVEAYLRTSEILFSIVNLKSSSSSSTPMSKQINDWYKWLIKARQNLALFQHHDGFTGTSKTPVVRDYAQKYFKDYISFYIH